MYVNISVILAYYGSHCSLKPLFLDPLESFLYLNVPAGWFKMSYWENVKNNL